MIGEGEKDDEVETDVDFTTMEAERGNDKGKVRGEADVTGCEANKTEEGERCGKPSVCSESDAGYPLCRKERPLSTPSLLDIKKSFGKEQSVRGEGRGE